MELLDSRILIRVLRELEPELMCAGALRHCLLINENAEGRLVRGLKGNPTWPDHRTWVENAPEFLLRGVALEQTAKELATPRLKSCFASGEDEITSLEERFVLLIDAVLDHVGPFPQAKDRVVTLLRDLNVDPAEVDLIGAIKTPGALSLHLASRAKNKGHPISGVRRKRYEPVADNSAVLLPSRSTPPVDPLLLADIRTQGAIYSYSHQSGSPLRQALENNAQEQFFLLLGNIGAGKTAALQYLSEESAFPTLTVPLSELYNPRGIRLYPLRPGQPRLLTWLAAQGERSGLSENCVLLADGLDQITSDEGADSFCDDLLWLTHAAGVRVVITSAVPPEQLPLWCRLRNFASLWSHACRCTLLPMRPDQKVYCLGHEPYYPAMLTTPSLLLMSRDSEGTPKADPLLLSRWTDCDAPPKDDAALFFRSLAAQICRWFRSDRGSDARSETDAFFLMYALPAVAFRHTLHEVYDRQYAPDLPGMETADTERLLAQAFSAYRHSLHLFPAYIDDCFLAALTAGDTAPDTDAFAQSRSGTVLRRTLCRETLEYRFQFSNRSVRDWMAALHLANLLFAASQNSLSCDPKLDDFYACPTRFLPHTMLRRSARLLDELCRQDGFTVDLLRRGPAKDGAILCRTVTARIAAALSAVVCPESESLWRDELRSVLLAQHFCADPEYTVNLCALSALARKQGDLSAAEKLAREAIGSDKQQGLVCADGHHALAMAYLGRINAVLNNTAVPTSISLPEDDFRFSMDLFRELQRSAPPLAEDPPAFSRFPEENRPLIPAFLQIMERASLRMQCLKAHPTLSRSAVADLTTLSFAAKAHSIYAALCPATSVVALNLLAAFLEHDREVVENHPNLPLYIAHPHLRLPMKTEELAYADGYLWAAKIRLRAAGLRRGLQPYSCRELAFGLLSRRFRLDETGMPTSPDGMDDSFTRPEQTLLDEMTIRACSRPSPTYAVPRIRFLNECIDSLPAGDPHAAELAEEAGALFRREWTMSHCEDKLTQSTDIPADLLAVSLAGEYRRPYLPGTDTNLWEEKLRAFFLSQKQSSIYCGPVPFLRHDVLDDAKVRLRKMVERLG